VPHAPKHSASQLTRLYLQGNNIGDAGAAALAEVLPQTKVELLSLCYNNIGDACKEKLKTVQQIII
jgi:hypothetical protein